MCSALGELERSLDGLLRSGRQERAGVDDGDVGALYVEGLLKARGNEKGTHAIGVDLVLRAAKRDEEDAAERWVFSHRKNPNDSC